MWQYRVFLSPDFAHREKFPPKGCVKSVPWWYIFNEWSAISPHNIYIGANIIGTIGASAPRGLSSLFLFLFEAFIVVIIIPDRELLALRQTLLSYRSRARARGNEALPQELIHA
jgi:hypothetical protein